MMEWLLFWSLLRLLVIRRVGRYLESLSPLLCAELVVSYGSLSAHYVHKHRFSGVIRHGVVIAVWVQQVHTFEAQCLWSLYRWLCLLQSCHWRWLRLSPLALRNDKITKNLGKQSHCIVWKNGIEYMYIFALRTGHCYPTPQYFVTFCQKDGAFPPTPLTVTYLLNHPLSLTFLFS